MHFDRAVFFHQYRLLFGPLSTDQVRGLERLLWGYETYDGWWDQIPQIANSLSQIGHETAHTLADVH